MGLLQELFRTHGPAYLERFGSAMPQAHKKVIAAITNCHPEAAGSALYVCEGGGQRHVVHRSCGNRHCQCCQQGKGHAWLERQRARQLPGEHFLLTFTVPEPLRPFLRQHQKLGDGALFAASSGAIKALAADPRPIGGDVPGFFGVLHTWGRTLPYHPHIHSVVVGGALRREDGRWHPARPGFYLPVRASRSSSASGVRRSLFTYGVEAWHVPAPKISRQKDFARGHAAAAPTPCAERLSPEPPQACRSGCPKSPPGAADDRRR
jgi:hypothetical protein